jgi:hypothetical protein
MFMIKIILFILSFTALSQEFSKPLCIPFKKDKLNEVFGKNDVSFLEFMALMNSREAKLEAGENLLTLVKLDEFDYGSEQEAIKLYQMANGLTEDMFNEDLMITLPFCYKDGFRELASSVGNIEKKLENDSIRKSKDSSLNISAQYGNLEIKSTDGDISMQFLKASVGVYYKINEDYFLTSVASAVQFRNIEHTETARTVEATGLYPELGISAFRRFDKINIGTGYDFLQYFIRDTSVTGVSLSPSATHRASAKASYSFTDNLVAFANLGYLKSFEENNISGIDSSIGAKYTFGKYNNYSITPAIYKGKVDRDSSRGTDSSSVISASFAYTF